MDLKSIAADRRRIVSNLRKKLHVCESINVARWFFIESENFRQQTRVIVTFLELVKRDCLISDRPMHQLHSAGGSIKTSSRIHNRPFVVLEEIKPGKMSPTVHLPEVNQSCHGQVS